MELHYTTVFELMVIFKNNPDVEKAVLFGSRAVDRASSRSDADIAVYTLKGTDTDTLADEINEQISNSDAEIPIDITLITPETNKLLLTEIENNGIVIYEAIQSPDPDNVLGKMKLDFFNVLSELDDALELKLSLNSIQVPLTLKLWRQAVLSLSTQCFERAWKLMRRYAIEEGYGKPINGSKDAIRAGWSMGIIDSPELWFNVVVKRNKQIHEYGEVIALEALKHAITDQISLYRNLAKKLGD